MKSRAITSLIFGCLISTQALAEITIATTIRPLQFIATAIVGDAGKAIAVIDGNDSPHSFSLSPSDRVALEQADLLLWVGPEFEIYLTDLFAQLDNGRNLITVMALEDMTVHPLAVDHRDPHLWLDTNNARAVAAELARLLSALDSTNADEYQTNLEAFGQRLLDVERDSRSRLMNPDKFPYIVYHDAYQYFEKQFGLSHELALVSDPDIQPGMRDIMSVRTQIGESNPVCLLLESDFDPSLVQTLLQGRELHEELVDLLGYDIELGVTAYAQLIQAVTSSFVDCLYPEP